MHTIGVVAGSFDPITNGHQWLIAQAARLVDELYIVVGVNHAKKYAFSDEERRAMVSQVIQDTPLCGTNVKIEFLRDRFLVHFAQEVGATHIIRGIRNAEDFGYETQFAQVNRKISPSIQTVYLAPPPELVEVSSSTIKGLVGLKGWELVVDQYVHPAVFSALKAKEKR